jgi:hypothetical protein
MLLGSLLAAVAEAPRVVEGVTNKDIFDIVQDTQELVTTTTNPWLMYIAAGGVVALAILAKLWFDTYYLAKNQKKLEELIKGAKEK